MQLSPLLLAAVSLVGCGRGHEARGPVHDASGPNQDAPDNVLVVVDRPVPLSPRMMLTDGSTLLLVGEAPRGRSGGDAVFEIELQCLQPTSGSVKWHVRLDAIEASSFRERYAYLAQVRVTDAVIGVFANWSDHTFIVNRIKGRIEYQGKGRDQYDPLGGDQRVLQVEWLDRTARE
jgi:hypothetical protein